MNTMVACCGHSVPIIGAPHSLARMACEKSPCEECRPFIRCSNHDLYNVGCHWCDVAKEAYLRMTAAEQQLVKDGKR